MSQFNDNSTLQFTLFLKLPRELQDEIWTRASSVPRIITIRPRRCQICDRLHISRHFIETLTEEALSPRCMAENCKVPSVLQVSRAAREAGLRCYKSSFTGRLRHPIYFNCHSDDLVFRGDDALKFFIERVPGGEKTCDVRSFVTDDPYFHPHWMFESLSVFPDLEMVTLQDWARHGAGFFHFARTYLETYKKKTICKTTSIYIPEIISLTRKEMKKRYGITRSF